MPSCQGPNAGTFLGLALPGTFFLAFGGGFLGLLAHRLSGAGVVSLKSFDTTERNLPLLHKLGVLVVVATSLGLAVECGGSFLYGCPLFSAHLFPGQELYGLFLAAGVSALLEGRGLLWLGAHKYATALALSGEGLLYLWHATSFTYQPNSESKRVLYSALGYLAFAGAASSLLSAVRPKLAIAHAVAHTMLVAQGAWYFYIAAHLHDPLTHPLRPVSKPTPSLNSPGVFATACGLVVVLHALAAAMIVVACRRAKPGAHAYLAVAEDEAELGGAASSKGQ